MTHASNSQVGVLTNPRSEQIQRFVVTADQMSQIEARVFAAGMPVAALMEKVAGLIFQRVRSLYPLDRTPRVGVLVGPGHNGGDALVVARELHLHGYQVQLFQPFARMKDLTATHAEYAQSLGISTVELAADLAACDLLIDGLFGFGLTRSLEGPIAFAIQTLNQLGQPILSIDIPSGLHTDTGAVLGTAIRATHSLCLGLWKRAFLQDQALEYLGRSELIDFGLPLADITAILGDTSAVQRLTTQSALAAIPLERPATTHKYQQGHVLLVCGSRRYSGAAILAGLAARASGVGMLSIAVPASLKSLIAGHLPDALVIDCPEEETGAIASLSYANSKLPAFVDLDDYDAIACGPGLTLQAHPVVEQVLRSDRPLILDADGLNILATLGTLPTLTQRQAPTILTPHLGEFRRLFPDLTEQTADRITVVQSAATQSGAIVLLKGARTAIAYPLSSPPSEQDPPQVSVTLIPESTPALARGGSGDVLTGLMAGLMAQGVRHGRPIAAIVQSAAWWHAQAGILAAQQRSTLGVNASIVVEYLNTALMRSLQLYQG